MDNQELRKKANSLLQELDKASSPYWRVKLREVYGPNNKVTADKAIKGIENFASKYNCIVPLYRQPGIIVGSVSHIANEFMPDLLPSDAVRVFNVLKASKRIMQVGGGKGKAIILFSVMGVHPSAVAANNKPPIDPEDTNSLLKALKETISHTEGDFKALMDKNKALEAVVDKQKIVIEDLIEQTKQNVNRSWY